ncbi:MAG TPA: P22 phage major capsid protein family protein [Rhizomicrobium sp.]|nr:P22 phage major capsid protein family protein [Rhizomicrobium sp.]
MANTLLTSTQVTRKALMILHQKLNFIGSINRGYDDSFSKDGAKIGDTLKIRVPNQYPVRIGATMGTSPATDTTENTVSLQVATQKGVDVNFSSSELTLNLDDFSDRVLEPAMSALAANIEADAMNMYKDVYQQVSNVTFKIDFNKVLQGRKKLVDSLAPLIDRTCNLNTQDNLDLVDALKGLFQDSSAIAKQYREGYMGRTAGFDFMENTLWPSQARGDAASYVCNTSTGITSGTAVITVSGGSGTFKKGDVFTIAGVNAVHPESKVDTGQLQQFVATTDSTTSISVSPNPISAAGATQNIVINSPGASKTVTVAGNASTNYGISMAYQKGAFAFATADLVLPRGVDFAAREVLDGISMRIVRQYDITNDKFPCRIDVLYGYKAVRPQLACRLANN